MTSTSFKSANDGRELSNCTDPKTPAELASMGPELELNERTCRYAMHECRSWDSDLIDLDMKFESSS
jgi:hypothetical protein